MMSSNHDYLHGQISILISDNLLIKCFNIVEGVMIPGRRVETFYDTICNDPFITTPRGDVQ
jgi:hypothetical protein